MEVELAKRRGQHLIEEGEQRGGDQSKSKVTSEVTSLSGKKRKQRHEDRALGQHPEVVDEYVKTEATAGRFRPA